MILRPITVLVVEDEPLLSETMVSELGDRGFSVVQAESAEEALSFIEADEPIDVLFTDIRLPGPLTGWDVAERFRAKNPHGPVIYATGYTEGPLRQVDQSTFLRKPYRPSTIVAEIRRLSGPA